MKQEDKHAIKLLIMSYWWYVNAMNHFEQIKKELRQAVINWDIWVKERELRVYVLKQFKKKCRELYDSKERNTL